MSRWGDSTSPPKMSTLNQRNGKWSNCRRSCLPASRSGRVTGLARRWNGRGPPCRPPSGRLGTSKLRLAIMAPSSNANGGRIGPATIRQCATSSCRHGTPPPRTRPARTLSACVTWGEFWAFRPREPERKIHGVILLDAWRGRLNFPELKQKALELYQHWKPDQSYTAIRTRRPDGGKGAAKS
jgi:hypothetical protein